MVIDVGGPVFEAETTDSPPTETLYKIVISEVAPESILYTASVQPGIVE